MLAQALASILPPLTLQEVIEITKIYSAAGLLKNKAYISRRPFRSPHQGASPAAVVGGGQSPRPGEISLAHRGVLFLDELPEFRRDILESLRQPIESRNAIISRVKNNLVFPAKFSLVAAMNPCPCGYYGDDEKECKCAAYEVIRYGKRLSGPLLDRIDIQIHVPRIKVDDLEKKTRDTKEGTILREKVISARSAQATRFQEKKGKITNSELTSKECDELIECTKEGEEFLKSIFAKSLISARGYYRILKVARTIADLESENLVQKNHIAEAFGYRVKSE